MKNAAQCFCIAAVSLMLSAVGLSPAHAAKLKEGDKAPDFTLKQQDRKDVTLSKVYEKNIVVLYFYPADDTPGCTKEACAFRDLYKDFKSAGIAVLGISVDDEFTHKNFERKYNLPFTLLADTDKKVTILYDVKSFLNKAKRITFVIDTKGIIKKIYPDVDVSTHGQEVLTYVKTLQKK